jgi:hypothetical protein
MIPGVVARCDRHRSKARFPSCLNIQGRIPDNEDVRRVDFLTTLPQAVFCRAQDQMSAVFGIGAETSKAKVRIQISPLKLNAGTTLDVSRSQAEQKMWMRFMGFQESGNPWHEAIVLREMDLFTEKGHVGVKDTSCKCRSMPI